MTRAILGILIGVGIGSVTGYFGKCSSGACPLTATPFRGAVYGGVLGLLFALTTAMPKRCDVSVEEPPPPRAVATTVEPEPVVADSVENTPDENVEALVHISDEKEFEQRVLRASAPCLVDFYSNNCPPCHMLGPTIEKLAGRYWGKAVICKVNLDGGKNADLAHRYGIRGIPAVLFFQNGAEVERLVGLQKETAYITVLENLLPTTDRPADATSLEQTKTTPLKDR